MAGSHIKQEMLDRSSPTIPNTSSRAQTVSSTAPSPMQLPSQVTEDPDATMSGLDHSPPLLQDAMHYLGADSRRLIQGIKKLEELNISTTLQLPKFVVVGDQSAGKSSIVEALCDISLPRSQGTCTRCPFLITTSSQAPLNGATWLCSISIQQEYYFHIDGPDDPGRFRKREGQIDPMHFYTVTKKSELEAMLRKAQLAILNPRDDPQKFVGFDLASAPLPRQVPFSPNVISLEIQGPNLPELYFYDLPGSINVIEDDEDPTLVRMIEDLVSTYLQDEKCLILLACGADQDVETSTTFRFIKNCRATERCAGVITKADLLPPGKLSYIKQILNGKKFALGKGWFFTKQLSQAQIDQGIGHAVARDLEAEFFRQQPWSGLPDLQSRFGIERLQEAVSQSMTKHIRGELPEIASRIATRLEIVTDQLTLLPAAPPHPGFAVASHIQTLAASIASHINGDRDVNTFRLTWTKITTTRFCKRLADMKPSFNLETPGYKAPSIVVDDDDGSEPATPTPVRVAIRSSMTPKPSVSRRNNNITPSSSKKRPAEDATPRRTKADPATPSFAQKSLTLETLRFEYARGNTSGVPGSINAKVTDRLILESLNNWNEALNGTLKDAKHTVSLLIEQSIDNTLKNMRLTDLYRRTKEELSGFLAGLMHTEGDKLHNLLACEQEKAIVTHSNWTTLRNARLHDMQSQRNLQRVNEHFDTFDAAIANTSCKAKPTPAEKRAEKAKDTAWLSQTLGADEYATEIDCLATIMCYYENAAMCFVNAAAKSIEHGVLRPLRSDIAHTLRDGLSADDPAVCARLLAEDPARERERIAMQSEKAKLEKAMASVDELQN